MRALLCRNYAFRSTLLHELIGSGSYSISDIYHPLNDTFSNSLQKTTLKNRCADSSHESLVEKLLEIFNKVQKITINETWRETQCDIIYIAYIPFITNPSSLNAGIYPESKLYRPTLANHLWQSPKIWKDLGYVDLVTGIIIDKDLLMLLFSCGQVEVMDAIISQISNLQWIHLCLLTAQRVIMRH